MNRIGARGGADTEVDHCAGEEEDAQDAGEIHRHEGRVDAREDVEVRGGDGVE